MPRPHSFSRWDSLALALGAVMRMKSLVKEKYKMMLYCSLFDKDYEFEGDKLVQLWLAAGLLENEPCEDYGHQFLKFLLNKKYILPRFDILTQTMMYKVNSELLASTFAQLPVIEVFEMRLEDGNMIANRSADMWHISVQGKTVDQTIFESLKQFSKLRTLLFLNCSLLKQVPSDVFFTLSLLTALDLSGSGVTELPSSIRYARELRYIDLSWTRIKRLPWSIAYLQNLQTLKLKGCDQLFGLPKGMKDLINLRHLEFDVLGQLNIMPREIGALTELRTLPAFIVDGVEGCNIKELKHLNNLSGKLCISGLEHVLGLEDAKEAALPDKGRLKQLELRWSNTRRLHENKEHNYSGALECLEPSPCLEVLRIICFPGSSLPSWIANPRYINLHSVTLFECEYCHRLPSLGQLPQLKNLDITEMNIVEEIDQHLGCGNEVVYDNVAFPALEMLAIDGMSKLKAWTGLSEGCFPCLHKLSIKRCPNFKKLCSFPRLCNLKDLEITQCPLLKQQFSSCPESPVDIDATSEGVCPPSSTEVQLAGQAITVTEKSSNLAMRSEVKRRGMLMKKQRLKFMNKQYKKQEAAVQRKVPTLGQLVPARDKNPSSVILEEGTDYVAAPETKESPSWLNDAPGRGIVSERIFFVIESIGDLFDTFEYDNDTKGSINELERRLRLMHGYLRSIEEREEELHNWSLLESIAGDAEDMLDRLTNGKNRTKREITDLIQSIDRRINSVRNSLHHYDFKIDGQIMTGSVSVIVRPNKPNDHTRVTTRGTYGHEQNRNIVGFQSETETLICQVMKDNGALVVGIVGMAGSGKTTLAKHLYHHADIQQRFDYKVWVCVSQSWNKKDILYEIFRKTAEPNEEEMKSWSEQKLMGKLFGVLSEQSYLIILDDLWDVDAWIEISPGIPLSKGSKVVVTTRNGAVPKLVDPAFFILETKPLNPVESYELFCQRTFTKQDEGERELPSSELVNLGKEMVMKCEGLPLAITALANALRVNKSPSHWMRISKTLTMTILKMEDLTIQAVVRDVLLSSYHDLPYHMRHCFLYLAIFPEDFEIRTGKLIKMWIAECLISRDPLPEEYVMQEAYEYVDVLCQRYMVIDVRRNYKGQVKAFRLHGLVREMCIIKAKEMGILNKSHRLALHCERSNLQDLWDTQLQLEASHNRSHVRSLVAISKVSPMKNTELMLKFKLLRVLFLEIRDCPVLSLPEKIGELIHLRCLCLEAVKVILPECIGNLQNLLTLYIRTTYTEGTDNLWRLKRLRHLCFRGLNEMSFCQSGRVMRLDQLENLRTLSYVRGGAWMLSEMRGLSPTLHKLGIDNIRRQEELDAVLHCRSLKLGNLQTLKLDWKYSMAVELKPQHMEVLKQCANLWKMNLCGRIQERMGEPLVFPRNLIKLEIWYAELRGTDLMDVLGSSLPCLQFLSLGEDAYLGTELTCRAGSFPELEQLEFRWLPYLEHWTVEKGAMPSLKDLYFDSCERLHQPPEGWRFVSNLKHVMVWKMPTQFEESLEQWREHHADLTIANRLLNF